MNQDDYKTEFEEHREEIKLDELNPSSTAHLPSRSERYRKNKPSRKSRHRLINTILGLFILIPLIILIIVLYDYYNPESDHNKAAGDSGIVMEPPGTDENNDDPDVIIDQPDEKDQDPSNNLDENKKPVSGVGSEAVDQNEEDSSSDNEQVDTDEGQNNSQEEESSSKIHTVSKGETIFRISVIYYKDGSGVDKIIEANELTSNHIIVGQKLIIP